MTLIRIMPVMFGMSSGIAMPTTRVRAAISRLGSSALLAGGLAAGSPGAGGTATDSVEGMDMTAPR